MALFGFGKKKEEKKAPTCCCCENENKESVDCGKEISRGCIRCKYCNGKSKIVSEENMPIDRNKLKELIFTIPFTKIGKMFGVTDNAIRKWCKKFNLPFKREDIIKYSEEEWINI